MQLLKSLFCWYGFDNRTRFIVISFLSFIIFIILNELFADTTFGAMIALTFCSVICLISTRRRLNDAQLHRNWIIAPPGSFLITGTIIIFIGHGGIYWLLLIPLLLSLLLLTYPGKTEKSHILGYKGPVDLSEYRPSIHQSKQTVGRIEPTMNQVSHHAHSPKINSLSIPDDYNTREEQTLTEQNKDLGETIRLALLSNKNAMLTLSIICALLIFAIMISLIFSNDNQDKSIIKSTTVPNEIIRLNKVSMPDNFDVMTSINEGIIISWQADLVNDKEIWSLASATGDKSCQSINFNKGDAIRSTAVLVENGSQYFANFSPLDTKILLKNIAFKGKFNLCGFTFSLKGSQVALGKNSYYANIIEY